MPKVTIDGTEYDTDTMDEEARRQLQNVVFCDRKLEELRNESAIIQTARNAYAKQLGEVLKAVSA